MELQELLVSLEEDAPSGENLEYDPEFIALELASQPGEERQTGDNTIPAEEPDWNEVKEKALEVLARSHDLRAAIHLAHAALYTDGLEGFAETTGLIRGMIEEFWDTCWPQLDADDDNDPTERVNAAKNLAESTTILFALRRSPLSESRNFGRFSLRDIQISTGEISSDQPGPDAAAIGAAFQDSDAEILRGRLAAVRKANENVVAIEKKFDAEVPGQGPNYADLVRMLRLLASTLSGHVGDEAEAGAESDAGAAADAAPGMPAPAGGGGAAAPAMGGGGPPGAVNSLGDVHAALDKIMAFYHRAEPSSPVPVLLARAKKLVGADFLAIMKDMAPQGLDNVRLIGGLPDDDD